MKPTTVLGFGLLLLLLLPVIAASDEPGPFPIIPSQQNASALFPVGRDPGLAPDKASLDPRSATWIEAELPEWEKRRLLEWIRIEWPETLPTHDLAQFLQLIRELHSHYLFAADGEGNLLRDDRGKPLPLSGEDAQADFQSWQQELEAGKEEMFRSWEQQVQVEYQELLIEFEALGYPELEEAAGCTLQQYKAEVRREFECLYRQAESQFLRLRLSSGKHSAGSDVSSADLLAEQLVTRTLGRLQDSSLPEADAEAHAVHSQAPLRVGAENWRQEFDRAFRRGIQTWNQAEQRLYQDRVRWETQARHLYGETEKAWQDAYRQFEQARDLWIEEMQTSLQTGLDAWQEAESQMYARFELQMQELCSHSAVELERLQGQLQQLLSEYARTVDVVELCETNIKRLEYEITALEAKADPGGADSLSLLQEELAYWQGEDGQGGLLAASLETLEQIESAFDNLENQTRAYGADLFPDSDRRREMDRLAAELRYLNGQETESNWEKRSAACQRITSALHLLEQIRSPSTMDTTYLGLKERELALHNTQQQVLLALDSMAAALGDLQIMLADNTIALERSVEAMFDFRQYCSPVSAAADQDIQTLTDFSGIGDGEMADTLAAYFCGDDEQLAERIYRDGLIWIREMLDLESGFQTALRDFGLAYYHDVVVQDDLALEDCPAIDIPILQNPNVTVLVEEYLNLGPTTRLVRSEGEIKREPYYPPSRFLPEDYLAYEAQKSLDALQQDPHTQRLYAYFKAMLASGHFAPGTDFIRDDLTDLAYRYIDAHAYRKYRHYNKWWRIFKRRKAKAIASLRKKIAPLHVTGEQDRNQICAAAAEIHGLADQRNELENRIAFLSDTHPDRPADREHFLDALQSIVSVEPDQLSILSGLFPLLDSETRVDNLSVLNGIASKLAEDLVRQKSAIQALVGLRQEEQQIALDFYLDSLYDTDCPPDALAHAVSKLFSDLPFSNDEYHEQELRYSRRIETATLAGQYLALSELAADIHSLMQHRLRLFNDRAQRDLQLEIRSFHDQRLQWESTIDTLLAEGLREWETGAHRIRTGYQRWLDDFLDEYAEKQQMWNGRYILFCSNRQKWMEDSSRTSAAAAGRYLANEFDLNADRLLTEVRSVSVPPMISQPPDLHTLVERAFPGPAMNDRIRQALRTDSIRRLQPLSRTFFIPQTAGIRTSGILAQRLAGDLGEEIYSRVSMITALQLRLYIEESEEAAHERIDEANRSMDDNLTDMLRGSGYRKQGSTYSRLAVIDNTLIGGIEDERQSVPQYVFFVAPAFDSGVDLSRASLEGLSGDYIQDLALRAQENLKRYMELIFGRSEESRDSWDWEGIESEFEQYFSAQTAAFRAAEGYDREDGKFHDIDGLFPIHIGYEPVMSEDDPERVAEAGFGELGLIMEAYYRNEARQARGLSMLCVPWYSLRIWDDDADNDGEADGWFEAPSTRQVVNVAVSIVATATGNVWATAGLNLVDDAVFTAADVAGGYLELNEGILSFGKQALIGAATVGTGVGFDALGGALGAFAEGGVCKALLEGVEITTNRVTGATIGAIELDSDGELMFNTARYKETLFGSQALRGYLAQVSGSTMGYLLEGNLTGFSSEHAAHVHDFSQLAGGLTQAGLEYALTGQTILNMADFSMFGLSINDRPLSGGFVELRLGGDRPLLAVGQSGPDISLSALTKANAGFDTWVESMRVRRYDRLGSWTAAEDYQGYGSVGTSMRSLYSFGDDKAQTLYRELLSGEAELHVGYTHAIGQTRIEGTSKQVHLATLGDYRNRNSRLMGGVNLQHEAYRDGVVSDPLTQQMETRRAVAARAVMLMELERKYGGIIGSEIENTIDVLMYTAGEKTFNRYVDELWNSEGDFAERIITKKAIGVRPTHAGDLYRYTPGYASIYRYGAARTGGDPYKDYLLPESQFDPQHDVIRDLVYADELSAQLNLIGIALGYGSYLRCGGSLVTSVFGLNPINSPDLMGAASALLNDVTVVSALLEALSSHSNMDTRYVSDDITKTYRHLAKGILDAQCLSDMAWYTRATAIFADSKIFEMAEKAGIPLEVQNKWRGKGYQEARVANQMMRNYMFVGEMVLNGITDPEIVRKMYYAGFANPVTMENGLTLWEHVPGFAEYNSGPWEYDRTFRITSDLMELISDMNAYNMTNYSLNTLDLDLYESLGSSTIDTYNRWSLSNKYQPESWAIWNDYDYYYTNVYLKLIGKH